MGSPGTGINLSYNQLSGVVALPVAELGGIIQGPINGWIYCQFRPGNDGLYMPNNQGYQDADLDEDGFICGVELGVPPNPPPVIHQAVMLVSNWIDGLGDGSGGNVSYFLELPHLSAEGDLVGLERDDIEVSVNGSVLDVDWRWLQVSPDGEGTRILIGGSVDGTPPFGDYSVTVRDAYGQTSAPFVIAKLEDLPTDAPDISFPQHLSTVTSPRPTFEWRAFQSSYLGEPLETQAYGLQLIPSDGQLFEVGPIPEDQTSLAFQNGGWTPDQPPDLTPGAYQINVSAFRAISDHLHFEHIRWIDFEVAEPSCSTQTEIPVQECEALVALYESTNGPEWTNHVGWLDFSNPCSWYGVTCFGVEARAVVELRLRNNNLSGPVAPELGELTNLEFLYLGGNRLTGEIPVELGDLSSLRMLVLENNQLGGEIPYQLGGLSSLTDLYIGGNQLSGSIPPELGNLTSLEAIEVGGNNLVGSIPATLGNLQNLYALLLWSNQLTGSIPPELGNLARLRFLYLSENQLNGTIPSSLGDLVNLEVLALPHNHLTGGIPSELGNLASLQILSLWGNDLTGAVPSELGNLANLRVIGLEDNQLGGLLPLPVAGEGGLLQQSGAEYCVFVPPGNEGLYIPDTEAYRAADLSGLGAICGVAFTSNAETVTEDLTNEIENLVVDNVLNSGQSGALTSKLDNALASVSGDAPTLEATSLARDPAEKDKEPNYRVAINLVNAFMNQVNDFVATGVLTPEEAAPLLERAEIMIELWLSMM